MPYVPSKKSTPPAEDRAILDPAVELAARHVAAEVHAIDNFSLIATYKRAFLEVAHTLRELEQERVKTNEFAVGPFTSPYSALGEVIYAVGASYGYVGAFLGELNYAITRLIQRVPQIMVETGKWPQKNELRYWSYACVTEALWSVALETKDWGIGIFGVFADVVLEYKWRVNRAYEAWQIAKSGDCYDAPYYTKLVRVTDESGKFIGYMDVYLERSDETVNQDVLEYALVAKKKKKKGGAKKRK